MINVIDIFEKGIKANEQTGYRKGNLIILSDDCDLVVAGDIHGHRRNFERVLSYADLENNPKRQLVMQEIIHGGPEDAQGGCLSFEVLIEAVKLKIKYPNRFHLILANHDTAFISNSEVMKNGKEMNQSMRRAMKTVFGESLAEVESAMERFLFSQPLAVKCQNGIWISHSLPANRFLKDFDFTIFDRQLKINDIVRPHSAYTLTWGRKQSDETLDSLAERLGVHYFILGHQVQETGWMSNNKNLIIIDSQHNHGHLCHIDLTKSYTIEELIKTIIPLAQIYL